jgi:hypothetical protein
VVTPRTGRARGRPRKPAKPAKPQRSAGRPTLSFFDDPDRYRVGCLDALLALGIRSESACARALAALDVAIEGGEGKLAPDGRLVTTWERFRTRAGATAATLDGRASTLREKQRRCRSPEEANWRRAMSSCFKVALHPRDRLRAKAGVLTLATVVGEGDFAQRVLWPMIDARFSGQFSINGN